MIRWATAIALVSLAILSPLAVQAAPLISTLPAGLCVGDCDGDGSVRINELLIEVNIALGTVAPSACPALRPACELDACQFLVFQEALQNAQSGCHIFSRP